MELPEVVDQLAAAVAGLLPLRVRAVDHHDPTLVLLGDGWSLALLGDWVWQRGGEADVPSTGVSTADEVWELVGVAVVGVAPFGSAAAGSTTFLLSGGGQLHVPAEAGWDTWVLRHGALGAVFVGGPWGGGV